MFYYIVIQTLADGNQPMSIYGKNTLDEALSQLHYDVWYAMDSDNIDSIMCLIINSFGNTERLEKWSRYLPPEPEVEEESE